MICDNCMNNPKNNPYASGFCNCTLPDMERGGWFQSGITQTGKTFVVTSNFSNFATGEVKRMTLSEAVKTIKEYCSKRDCKNCFLGKLYKNEWLEDGGIWGCILDVPPREWRDPPETKEAEQ